MADERVHRKGCGGGVTKGAHNFSGVQYIKGCVEGKGASHLHCLSQVTRLKSGRCVSTKYECSLFVSVVYTHRCACTGNIYEEKISYVYKTSKTAPLSSQNWVSAVVNHFVDNRLRIFKPT